MTIDTETKPSACALARAVGAKLRDARKRKGMALDDIARLCETTPQTICRLEIATMTLSVDWIEKICIALDIEPYTIFPHPGRDANAKLEDMRTEVEVMRLRSVDFIGRMEEFLKETE